MTGADLPDEARSAAASGESVTTVVLNRFGRSDTPAGLFDLLNFDAEAIPEAIVVAAPGERLEEEPRAGDVVVSRMRGERDAGRLGVVMEGGLADRAEVRGRGRPVREPGPGLYAEVIGDAPQVGEGALRLTDAGRRLGIDRMLVRARAAATEAEATPARAGTEAMEGDWEGEHWPGVVGEPAPPAVVGSGVVPAGRLIVDDAPVLRSHRGVPPDLVITWNTMPTPPSSVDVVVHFHGYSSRGAAMRLDRDVAPNSGLDFANPLDPADRARGRARPTVCLLPRGNWFGGTSGAGYDHPALVVPDGLRQLIALALDRFAAATRVQSIPASLILTAHGGGGAGVLGALRHNDPQEIHLFDALHGPADGLLGWARARIAGELSGGARGGLRVLYSPTGPAAPHSRELARALHNLVVLAGWPTAAERFRVEATTTRPGEGPRRFGWRLLADAAADLEAPATADGSTRRTAIDLESEAAVCRPGEGPAAAEPDPSGRALHPPIHRGTSPAQSRRPAVGYAQQCLNEFLRRHQAGTFACHVGAAGDLGGLIATTLRTLAAAGQLPLAVDCRFGAATEAATRAFQACMGVARDGRIGATTWPLLEAIATAAPLSALEGRYFPPPGTADAAPFSRASTVEPIVDGEPYFAAIKRRIDALVAGDAWYLAGWWVNPRFTFADGAKLGDLLVHAASHGVDVRVIAWVNRQVLENPRLAGALGAAAYTRVIQENVATAELLRQRVDARGQAVLADRVLLDWSGNAASSHHMKFTVFAHRSALTAFIGGLDYQQNRMDAPMHRSGGAFWHDVGVEVRGDAAARALETFTTRWNEASTLSRSSYDLGAGPKPYNPSRVPSSAPLTSRPAAPSPHTSVQVLRSFPDSKEFHLLLNTPWATLPSGGVHEVLRTFRTALGAARRYIYIEDQSFDAVDSLFPALAAACRRGVKVIAVLPGTGDPLDAPGRAPRELSKAVVDGILARLTPLERTNLAVWQLDGIVVHAKLVLIDDEYMSIGSANFMDRSMQFTSQGDDSELTVAAVSTSTLVSDLRVRLWAEHLRASDPAALIEIRDLGRSLGFWRSGWGSGVTFAHPESRLVFVGPNPGAGHAQAGHGSSDASA